jgi:hypothetical protein
MFSHSASEFTARRDGHLCVDFGDTADSYAVFKAERRGPGFLMKPVAGFASFADACRHVMQHDPLPEPVEA